MPQVPLDYQTRSEAAAVGRGRLKRAAAWIVVGLMMVPFAAFVAVVASTPSARSEWARVAPLLIPYGVLYSAAGRGSGEYLNIALAQFPLYGLILGASELIGGRVRRRALIAIGSAHLLAFLVVLAVSYAAGG